MKKMIIAVALLLSSQAVMAEWVKYVIIDDFDAYYNDDSVRKRGSKVKVWVIFDYNSVQAFDDGLKYMSSKNQLEFDCYNELVRMAYYSAASKRFGKGEVVWSHNTPDDDWRPVIPESVDAMLFKRLCPN
jgi:hypothetical protein